MSKLSRHDAEELDRADPLAASRAAFELPEGLIYLDGNSLGPLPRHAANRLDQAVREEWGESLIRGWKYNEASNSRKMNGRTSCTRQCSTEW